jgi:putative ABC transport system permease protein
LGVLLGWGGLHVFLAASPGNIPRLTEVALDGTALIFTLGLSLLTGVVFGLAPAWQFLRPDLNQTLKDDSQASSASTGKNRTRNLLVIAEVAVSMVLLAGAGLMLQSFGRMIRAERGFAAEHLLTAELDFSVSGFTGWTRPTATRPQVPLRALMERIRSWPGVQAVGAGSRLIRRENRQPTDTVAIFGRPPVSRDDQPRADFKGITPDWLRALGARVLRGRDFTEADTLESPGVVLINETLARRYFPNEDPIGQRLKMGSSQPPLSATNNWGVSVWSEIVGVVSDIKSLHPHPEVVPEVYQPYWQWPMQNPTLLVRTTGDPGALAEAIRREVKATIPNLPLPLLHTMDELVANTRAQPRLQTGLLSIFAALALGLSAVGLYGVLGYNVTQRRREIGVRMALGAQPGDVLRQVLGRGMRLALIGIGAGLLGALALTRVLQGMLFEVQPHDPLTFAAVPLLLIAVTALACWFPARRAAKLHPMEALRHE